MDREQLIRFTRESLGRLDLLVNNAGITSIGRADLLNATEENWDALMAVNLKGPFFLSQLAARWMIEQAEADQSVTRKLSTSHRSVPTLFRLTAAITV